MKRSLLVVMVLGTLMATSAWAQMAANVLTLPTVGIRGGIDIARERMSPSNNVSLKNQTGGAAGINYEFSVYQPAMNPATGLSLRTDLLWVRTGGRITSGNVVEKDKVDELRLAPFLVYRFASRQFVPFIQAGVFGGVDLSHKYTLSGNVAGLNVATSGTIPNWRNGNFGVNAGLGFKVPMPSGAISVDSRYSWGLVNKFKSGSNNLNSIVGNGSGLKRHTDGLLILAGYDINLGRAERAARRY